MSERLAGRVAVITGATSGIGACTAELFAAEGALVVLAGRTVEKGEALAQQLGAQALFVPTDVCVEGDVRALIDRAVAHFGRIDILFNNAGSAGPRGTLDEVPVEAFDAAFALLVRSVFLGIKYAAPVMRAQGRGSIINNASVAAHRTGYSTSVYSVAKAAVVQMTRCAAVELAPHGIRVNSVSPGFIATAIFGKAFGLDAAAAERSAEVVGELAETVGLPVRAGTPEDVARVALFLASDDAAYVNAEDIVVDGGMIAGRWHTEMRQRFGQLAAGLRARTSS